VQVNPLKSKTFWGAVAVAVAGLLGAETIDQTSILHAVGLVLGALGIRDAIAKVE